MTRIRGPLRRPGTLAAAIACVAVAAPIAAAGDFVLGGGGGEPYRISCGADFLVGLAGTASDVIERIAPLCVSIDAAGRWTRLPDTRQAVGSDSGVPIMFRTMCPPDTVATGFEAYTGAAVRHLSLWCRGGAPGTARVHAVPRTVGGMQHVRTGESGGCGPGEAANGIVGRVGDIIDAFGLTCVGVLLGQPQQVPEPVPPAVEFDASAARHGAADSPAEMLQRDNVVIQAPSAVERLPGSAVLASPPPVDGFEPPHEVELPREFPSPEIDGLALDYCLTWGQNCGKPAGDAFCRSQGYAQSVGHQVLRDAPPTRIIGDGAICRESYCARIIALLCAR